MNLTGNKQDLVLDSWPILEWIKGREPACSVFRTMMGDAQAGRVAFRMSRINHGEVVYSIHKDFPRERVAAALLAFAEVPIELYSVDDALVDEAVQLKCVHAISYADAFAVALSVRLGLQLVTGDRELRRITVSGFRLLWVGA